MRNITLAVIATCISVVSRADILPEVEPNDRRASANPVTLNCGDGITGSSTGLDQFPLTGPGTVDHFLVSTSSAPGALRRYRLTVGPPARDLTLRGRTPASSTADALIQTSFPAAGGGRYVLWYGFGVGGTDVMNVRVGGDETTTEPYVGTLDCANVTPVLLSHVLPEGSIRVRAPGGGNVAIFDPLYNNQPGWTGNSVTLVYSPGEYFVGVSPSAIYAPNSSVARTVSAGMSATPSAGSNFNATVEFSSGPNQSQHDTLSLHFGDAGEIAWVRFFVSGSGAGACCIGAGCTSNLSSANCASAGGVFLGGGVPCVLDLCARACCYPDGECRFITAADCTNTGGAAQALGATCATTACPAPFGAGCPNPIVISVPAQLPYTDTRTSCGMLANIGCTSQNEDVIYRLDITQSVCLRVEVQSGLQPQFAFSSTCPPCPTSTATIADPVLLSPGTRWLSVRPNPCGAYTLTFDTCEPRACCFDDGSCQMLTPPDCTQAQGHVQAASSTCAASPCPPAQTCCLAAGGCLQITAQACANVGGRLFSRQPSCEPNLCDDVRACCLPNATCVDVSVAQCLQQSGLLQAAGSTCPASCVAVCLRGDINCDGSVNNFDIDPFVQVILNFGLNAPPPGWTSTPECWVLRSCTGDADHSGGTVTGFDIDPFVACIVAYPPVGQPCP